MSKIYKSFSLCLTISMLFCFVTFAVGTETVPPATMPMSSNQTVVNEGDTLTLSVSVSGVTDVVTGGTITINKSVSASFGELSYTTGYVTGVEGSFTLATPAAIADNTVICTIPVTVSKLPAGTPSESIQLANLVSASCILTKDGGNVALTVNETPITVTVNKKAPTAKITLNSTITSLKDFNVELVKDESIKIATILTLMPDKKTIAVDLGQAIEQNVEYTVVVTGAGYLSNNFKYTSTDGSVTFNVTNFYAGDVNVDGKIDINDFNDLCTKVFNQAPVTITYDLNHDNSISNIDIPYLVSGWLAGGAF